MIGVLIKIRLRSMLESIFSPAKQGKRKGKGMTILFAVIFLYLAIVICASVGVQFWYLAPVFHGQSLDWVYFALAGLIAMGSSVLVSVFVAQDQLYNATDNEMLLSMPIPPWKILFSRMVPLFLTELLVLAMIFGPVTAVYGIRVGLSNAQLGAIGLCVLGMIFLSLALVCLLGWLMHLLLARINRALAALGFMIAFLAAYFSVIPYAGTLIQTIAVQGQQIGNVLERWIWPVYALGMGCTGSGKELILFLLTAGGTFGAVYFLLSKTFLHLATARRSGNTRKKTWTVGKAGTPVRAVLNKEWRHFLDSPVYLTNLSMGIFMTAAVTAAGILFHDQVLGVLETFGSFGVDVTGRYVLLICGMLSIMNAMSYFSAPSVSLEGKNLWILRSMPMCSRDILMAKVLFHLLLTTPVYTLSGLLLAIVYGCRWTETILCTLFMAAMTLLCALVGMVFGLQWAKLDWISEAYPCKQGMAVGVTLLGMVAFTLLLAGGYLLLSEYVASPAAFLLVCLIVVAGICIGLVRCLCTWGVQKWEAL